MILSKETIMKRVGSGSIGLDPSPRSEQYQPASLDLRLGDEVYDVTSDERYTVSESVTVDPGDRLLGHTWGTIDMPDDLAGQVTGRSSLGRLFVTVHQTAGWIDPGFTGEITFEIANLSHSVVELAVGQRVAQMVFFRVDNPSDSYGGQYQNDRGPQPGGEL